MDDIRLPEYEANPLAWNSAWENLAASETPYTLSSTQSVLAVHRYGEPTESILKVYRGYWRYLCRLQYDLTVKATLAIAKGFEGQWLAATPTVRRNHHLEGHIRVAIAGFESFRELCGDITLASLERNSGKGFLELLGVYILNDLSTLPTTPVTFPYNGMSQGIPLSSDIDIWHALAVLDRNMYICFFLDYTLNSWANAPRPRPKALSKTSASEDLDPQMMKIIKSTVGRSSFKEAKQELRQCQKDDWPRHKQVCGKKMTPQTARNIAIAPQKNASENLDISQLQIGLAIGGYKRSPALVSQAYLLNLHPDIDYFVTDSSGEFNKMTMKDAPSIQKPLRAVRDKAMTTGDRTVVAVLGEFLVVMGIKTRLNSGDKLTRESVMNQLVLEYGEGIRKDIHVLEVISYNDTPGMTQLVNMMMGKEVCDVSALPTNWETLESNFQKRKTLRN
ncbi:hypothetical protein Hypma_001527 [Hypsizygus marmoreus]|uniref:Uncharacterized protein n=1 Tax=Hypsizygus marmoreus TaxID=39966 RepID=A0A369K134_HYPMA|nr:hypothetical protein Hypma_001527 [Hypsizygus marmoreus]